MTWVTSETIIQSIDYHANSSTTCLNSKGAKARFSTSFLTVINPIWVAVSVSGTGKKLFILKSEADIRPFVF